MKRILIVHYSQSGQLNRVVESIAAPLLQTNDCDVTFECIKPKKAYPFPWPFLGFFDTFPETVYDQPKPIVELSVDKNADFDLIILAYQVWFLSPSQPITAFLQSAEAEQLLRDKPIITVIGCRNMWLMAQEKVKQHVQRLGATLIDNVVLTDPSHSAATFLSTPLWVLTGNKGPFLKGLIPTAGISEQDITNASRFGEAIARQLPQQQPGQIHSMLKGLGAVRVNERLIASETIASRSFHIWGGLLRALGQPGQLLRRLVLVVYIIFLLMMILTVVPVTAAFKQLIAPLTRDRITRQRDYFSAPSGESIHLMETLDE